MYLPEDLRSMYWCLFIMIMYWLEFKQYRRRWHAMQFPGLKKLTHFNTTVLSIHNTNIWENKLIIEGMKKRNCVLYNSSVNDLRYPSKHFFPINRRVLITVNRRAHYFWSGNISALYKPNRLVSLERTEQFDTFRRSPLEAQKSLANSLAAGSHLSPGGMEKTGTWSPTRSSVGWRVQHGSMPGCAACGATTARPAEWRTSERLRAPTARNLLPDSR